MLLLLQSGGRAQALLRWLILGFVVALMVRHWVWTPVLIRGESMLPTLRDGQFVGVNKLADVFRSPDRGDVVVIWTGKEFMVKRVVGLPGEEIAVRDGNIYLNGNVLKEPYVTSNKSMNEIRPGKIGPRCFVVAGDNRSQTLIAVVSTDRRVGRFFCLLRKGGG